MGDEAQRSDPVDHQYKYTVHGWYDVPHALWIREYHHTDEIIWLGDSYSFKTKEEAEEAIATAKLLKGLT